MGREHLEGRDNWQRDSAIRGSEAERAFDAIMQNYVIDTDYEYEYKPKDLRGIYGLQPSGRRGEQPHGILPEAVIRSKTTGRAVYVEVKRQRAAGNAHERACKYFAPGIIASARAIARQPEGIIPFWWIFTNGIATDPRYVQEITHWFHGVERHLLLWESIQDYEPVISHFERHIQPMLG